MRTRKETDKLIENGVEILQEEAGICAVVYELRERLHVSIDESFLINNEIAKIGKVAENNFPPAYIPFFLGRPYENKEFRATILALAIEKLYGDGKL